jgi:preprotein translocase subunit SecA
MLSRKHNVKHEVLNAKQHEREADIILSAGQLGAVMIATNMAGRGTDIKLGSFTPTQLIEHWQRRGICPRDVTPDMGEDQIVKAVYRHIAGKELDLNKGEVQNMSDDDVRLRLLRHWASHHCWSLRKEPQNMSEAECMAALDENGSFLLHRLRLFTSIEDMGGLHVIGTERHESRRIDNQLRGRSGRQGDNGSSRFFLSLEDDLMKMFAGPTTLKLLSKLGMKEGDAIEHPMLTKSVGRAQRKVEERNFLIRKNILEYDEVMDHQRHSFYGMRQGVLEGRNVKELIFSHIDDSVQDAVGTYLNRNYQPNCISEWVRENLSVAIDPERIRGKDREDLNRLISVDAKEEASNMIRVTIGEYMPGDIEFGKGKVLEADETDWDLKGLVDWANASFKADLKVAQIEKLSRAEVTKLLEEKAAILVDEADLSPLDRYLVPNYGAQELAKWAANKFGGEFKVDDFAKADDASDAADVVTTILSSGLCRL